MDVTCAEYRRHDRAGVTAHDRVRAYYQKKGYGFMRTVPGNEIENRISRFQKLLADRGIDLALVRQNADLYYFSGTVQDAHLFIPAEGEPLMLVWRSWERAARESPLERIRPLAGLSAVAGEVRDAGLDCSSIGLEMDVLPAFFYNYYTSRSWPGVTVHDITPLIRSVRAVKSDWEAEQIRAACRQVAEALEIVPEVLKPGIPELELAARVEAELRRRGHPGYSRMRGWNQELGCGQFLSGPDGALAAWTNTPGGGMGVNPAFGFSAGPGKIGPDQIVSIDLGGSVNGYLSDQTRLFFTGAPPETVTRAYSAVSELQDRLAEMLVPGATAGALYEYALDFMSRLGYQDHFMGSGRDRVPFVGHGLGIEIDEFPFLAAGNSMEIVPGMTVAVEPKLVFPGIGIVGLEDTYLVTGNGAERLTLSPRELICL